LEEENKYSYPGRRRNIYWLKSTHRKAVILIKIKIIIIPNQLAVKPIKTRA
jgi:hypothetical protein